MASSAPGAETAQAGPSPYRGRFAPSPTGPLHAGSLVAALASWLDARAHRGCWLVRIEDIDPPRCAPGADRVILRQLADCGLMPDAPPQWQSRRHPLYQQALDQLAAAGLAYPCGCTRKDIEAEWARRGVQRGRHAELVYPGTCRDGLRGGSARAWRLRSDYYLPELPISSVKRPLSAIESEVPVTRSAAPVTWFDRRLGPGSQNVGAEVGDFVLRRADGLWAYQLAVVVDDAEQGITDVVRGEDLADNTPRQILLQRALGLATPRYLHTPLVRAADGEKLSKQHGAPAVDTGDPQAALNAAAATLTLPPAAGSTVAEALAFWTAAWRARWCRA